MKQRFFMLAAAAMMPFAVAVAQTPPTPPAQAVPPVQPALPTPVVTPVEPARPTPAVTPVAPGFPIPAHLGEFEREEIRRAAEEARRYGQLAAEDARRIAQDVRILSADAVHEARIAGQHALTDARIAMESMRFDTPRFSGQGFTASIPFEYEGRFFNNHPEIGPPPQFAQGEPADSLYQLAREAFNRQDYSRAATIFADMIGKYPTSRQVPAAAYYQAFSLYRVGTVEALRNGLKVLEANTARFEYDYNKAYRNDAPVLQARILRALAERNEPGVENKLRDLYAKYPAASCDKEAIGIKSQVLNSLYQTDPESALPYVRQHLATRDACNAELRRSALFLLANRPTAEGTALIVQAARTDTVRSVRTRAIEVLSRMPGDDAISALQQLMSDSDEQIQAAAVRSLMRSDNPRARSAMRSLIDRREAPERQRIEAIQSYDRDNTTADDAAYLRGLFNRQGESDRIKESVILALSRTPTEENVNFLLGIARSTNESSSLRSSALRRVTSRQSISTDDLIKLYDASDSRSMRTTLVQALGQRSEEAALNKMLDVVRYSTDPEVRSYAIQVLLAKKDPAITKRVLDLINKPSGG